MDAASGDRRQGVHALIRSLAEHVVSGNPEMRLHTVLEARLARLLGASRAAVVPVRPVAASSSTARAGRGPRR